MGPWTPDDSPGVALARRSADGEDACLVLANVDFDAPRAARIPHGVWVALGAPRFDLASGNPADPSALPGIRVDGDTVELSLGAGATHCGAIDDELRQRLDVRRFPVATVELQQAHALPDDTYRVGGLVTLHGISAQLQGSVKLVGADSGELTVTGEQVVDIRDFDIDVPSVLMLRIYPDVKVALHLVAREVSERPVL